MTQLDMFAQEPDADFIKKWKLLDSPCPYGTGPSPRLCYGLVSFRLMYLKRNGLHQEAHDLAIAGGIRVCDGDMHWARLYPAPTENNQRMDS